MATSRGREVLRAPRARPRTLRGHSTAGDRHNRDLDRRPHLQQSRHRPNYRCRAQSFVSREAPLSAGSGFLQRLLRSPSQRRRARPVGRRTGRIAPGRPQLRALQSRQRLRGMPGAATVSKTVRGFRLPRGFESLPLRCASRLEVQSSFPKIITLWPVSLVSTPRRAVPSRRITRASGFRSPMDFPSGPGLGSPSWAVSGSSQDRSTSALPWPACLVAHQPDVGRDRAGHDVNLPKTSHYERDPSLRPALRTFHPLVARRSGVGGWASADASSISYGSSVAPGREPAGPRRRSGIRRSRAGGSRRR